MLKDPQTEACRCMGFVILANKVMTQQDLGRSESGEQGCWKEAREVHTNY